MGFIADEDAIASVVKISSQMNVTPILGKKTEIVYGILVPIFGYSFINQIEGYETSPTAVESDLFKNINEAIIKLALWKYIPEGELVISDSGIQRAESEEYKTAYAGQTSRLSDSLLSSAYIQIDAAIAMCYQNLYTNFIWTPIYLSSQGLIFKKSADFTAIHRLKNPELTFYHISPIIRQVHDEFTRSRFPAGVLPLILVGTYNDIVKQCNYELKVAIANQSIAVAMKKGLVAMDEKGVRFIGGGQENSYVSETAPDPTTVSAQIKEFEDTARLYFQKASDTVKNNPASFNITAPTSQSTKTQFFV